MNAKKCDRCGKLYNLYGHTEKGLKANGIITKCTLVYGDHCTVKHYDLCPVCMYKLNKWLRGANNDR